MRMRLAKPSDPVLTVLGLRSAVAGMRGRISSHSLTAGVTFYSETGLETKVNSMEVNSTEVTSWAVMEAAARAAVLNAGGSGTLESIGLQQCTESQVGVFLSLYRSWNWYV